MGSEHKGEQPDAQHAAASVQREQTIEVIQQRDNKHGSSRKPALQLMEKKQGSSHTDVQLQQSAASRHRESQRTRQLANERFELQHTAKPSAALSSDCAKPPLRPAQTHVAPNVTKSPPSNKASVVATLTSISMALSVLTSAVTVVELWAGCCSIASPMRALSLPRHTVNLVAFSEQVSYARAFSSSMFPEAQDLGAYSDSMHNDLAVTPTVVTVSFDCAPYVVCGNQLMHKDERAQQIPQTLTFVKAVAPHLVWMEQAKEFFDNDDTHGLLSLMEHELQDSMVPFDTVKMYDPDYGGYLHRTRGFKVWEDKEAFANLPVPSMPRPNHTELTPLIYLLDPVEDVSESLRARGKFVPNTTTATPSILPMVVGHMHIVPGEQWQLADQLMYQGTLYRIDKLQGQSVRMFPQNRWRNETQNKRPIIVKRHKLQRHMARAYKVPVFSIHTAAKSPRSWGEHPEGNIAIYLDDRLQPPMPRTLSAYSEKIKIMRHRHLPGSMLTTTFADDTTRVMQACNIPDNQVSKLMGRSITIAMTIPWAMFLVDRDRLWQTWQQARWHEAVPMKHIDAPHITPNTIRVCLLVTTHDPVGSVLLSTSIDRVVFCPTDDLPGSKCTQDVIDATAQWCRHLGIASEPFEAGCDTQDSLTVVAIVAPVPHADSIATASFQSALRPSMVAPNSLPQGRLKFAAQLAVARIQMFLGPSPELAPILANPFQMGKSEMTMLKASKQAQESTTIPFAEAVRLSIQADRNLRRMLEDPLTLIEFERDKAECVEHSQNTIVEYGDWGTPSDWASSIQPMNLDDIPAHMRQCTPVFDDPALRMLPFDDTCCLQHTTWLPLSPNQTVDQTWLKSLKSRADLYTCKPDDVTRQEQWLTKEGQQCSQYYKQAQQAVKTHKGTAVFDDSSRHINAQGRIFNTSCAGAVTLVQFDTPKNEHLNKPFLNFMLKEAPDQEILSMLMLGFRMKAPLHTHSVYMTHGESLAPAYAALEQQMLSQEELGMVSFHQHPPTDPMRLVSHGAVPRSDDTTVSETHPMGNNPRLTDNHSAPLKAITDGDGWKVVPLNVSHKTNTVYTPNPHEDKPTVPMKTKSSAVLLELGHRTNLPLRAIKADAKYFFNQFELAEEDVWKMCRVLRPFKIGHSHYTIGSHKRLGYGSTPASNYGQRIASAFCYMIDTVMSWICNPYEIYKDEPMIIEWLTSRQALNANSRKRQDALWDTDQYTDDLFMLTLGDDIAKKAIFALHIVKHGSNMVMASFGGLKNQLGSSMVWTGAHMHLMLGMACIPKRKQLKAIGALRQLWNNQLMTKDYERFLGLVVHILQIVHCEEMSSSLSDLWAPVIFLGATQYIRVGAFAHLHDRWTRLDDALHHHTAAYFWNDLPDSVKPQSFTTVIHLFGDAFRNHDTVPIQAGIGGFLEGYWWFHEVDPDVAAVLFTPQLEAATVPANFLVMQQVLPSPQPHTGIAIHSDSLGTALNLPKDRAHDPVMHYINDLLWDMTEVRTRREILMGSHLDGLGNPAADMASRNMVERLANLARIMNVKFVRLQVPETVPKLLRKVAHFARQRKLMYKAHAHRAATQTEQGTAAAFSSCVTGDGPTNILRSPPQSPTMKQINNSPAAPKQLSSHHMVQSSPQGTQHRSQLTRSPQLSPPPRQQSLKQTNIHPTTLTRSPPQDASPCVIPRREQRQAGSKRQLCFHTPLKETALKAPRTSHPPAGQLSQALSSDRYCEPHLSVELNVAHKQSITVDKLMAAYASRPQYQICPQNPELLEGMVHTHLKYVDKGVPNTTKSNEKSALKKWTLFCADIGANPMRPPPNSLSMEELWVENMLLGLFCPYAWDMMEGRKHTQADPNSALKVVSLVNKVLGRHNDDRFDTKYAKNALVGMLVEHVDTHGPITTRQQHPFTRSILAAMFQLPKVTLLGSYTYDLSSPEGANLNALFQTAPESGTRCDEVTVNSVPWTKRKMSKASLSWHIAGVIYTQGAPPEILRQITENDFASIRPATSKCDRWGKKHGNKPIILPFRRSRAYNACHALRDMELADPVYGPIRSDTPLFRDAEGDPFQNKFVRYLLKHMLEHPSVATHRPAGVTSYSFHSFRRYYATCLGASGADTAQIQSMCRWLSDEAVQIYNVMTNEEKIGHVDAAYAAAPEVLTSQMIKQLAITQIDDDALYRTWCTQLQVDIVPCEA